VEVTVPGGRSIEGYVAPGAMDSVKDVLVKATVVEPGSRLIFVTGMVALSEDGGEVLHPFDTESQCRSIYRALGALLEDLGGSLADVVKLTVFMRDLSEVEATLRVRREFWPGNPPSSTTVGISQIGLPTESLRLEIEAVAAVPAGRSDGADAVPRDAGR
jgi:2-iminobutanoate/2-iminopropanoate deaminase